VYANGQRGQKQKGEAYPEEGDKQKPENKKTKLLTRCVVFHNCPMVDELEGILWEVGILC